MHPWGSWADPQLDAMGYGQRVGGMHSCFRCKCKLAFVGGEQVADGAACGGCEVRARVHPVLRHL